MGYCLDVAFYIMCFVACFSFAQQNLNSRTYEVEDLLVEPDYRGVRISWKYPRGPYPAGFMIRICETTGWRSKQPCRQRHLSLDGSKQMNNFHDTLRSTSRGQYEAEIYELRMFTNYSFTVEPYLALGPLFYTNAEFERAKLIKPRKIHATTKGFSARASRCLGNSTDVEVQTGKYFAGKISVEGSMDDRCAIYGEPTDPRSIYTLTINHKICGSERVNYSRIETSVLVHENKELVTHNSRRFLVICNFMAENFTIKATLNIPTVKRNNDLFQPIGHSISEADPNDILDKYQEQRLKHNKLSDSRILAEHAAIISDNSTAKTEASSTGHLAATVFLATTFTIVFLATMFWIVKVSRAAIAKMNSANNNEYVRNDANEDQAEVVVDSSSIVSLNDEENLVEKDISLDTDFRGLQEEEITR